MSDSKKSIEKEEKQEEETLSQKTTEKKDKIVEAKGWPGLTKDNENNKYFFKVRKFLKKRELKY